MGPLAAVTAILVLFALLAAYIAWVDGLTFLAPRSTAGILASAEFFCTDDCRVDGRCPLAGTVEPAENCPLRRFIEANAPTQVRGRPPERPFAVTAD